jgi:probable biosynthetic protein (TIGR04098 family)
LIEENQSITFEIELDRFGSSIIRSRQTGFIKGAPVIALEMITKFVSRVRNNLNDLRPAPLELKLVHSIPDLSEPPELVRDFQKVRDGARPTTARNGRGEALAPQGTYRYQPNPYVDYNGAGLLYFASYPAVADHIERLLLMQGSGRSRDDDWALRSGTSARDVFYFGNLDLGQDIDGELKSAVLAADESEAELNTVLREASEGRRIAELFTSKTIL